MATNHDTTEFLDHLTRLASGIIKETTGFAPTREIIYPQKRSYSIKEEYVISVFAIASDIQTTCNHLKHSAAYLGNFRTTPSLQKSGINKISDTVYHLENHAARLHSVFDEMILLINEVFMLGNQPKYCTEDIVLKSNTIQETKVANLMSKLKYIVTMHANGKYEIVPQHHQTNKKADNTELLYILAKADPAAVPEKLEFKLSGNYLQKRKKELSQINKEISDILALIFEQLQNEFERRYAMLKVLS